MYSQGGEEAIILEVFGAFVGCFLDIGALDGVSLSNTRALSELGWSGLCVEANPYAWQLLHSVYPDDPVKTLCASVWPHPEIRTLHLNQDGLTTSIADVFGRGQSHGLHFYGSCLSPTVHPRELARFGPFDFVSIDAEGCDVEIVRHGREILAGTRLLCVEKFEPCSTQREKDRRDILEACSSHGFIEVVGETPGNILLTRKGEA